MEIAEIKKLYKTHNVPLHIQAHMQAVAKYTKKLSTIAKKRGHQVDSKLIYRAALLHDLFRLEKNHEALAADYLLKMGYKELSHLIRHHGFMDAHKLKTMDQKILFYADKRICEDKAVTLHERFREAKLRKSILKPTKKSIEAEKRIFNLEEELTILLGQLPDSL